MLHNCGCLTSRPAHSSAAPPAAMLNERAGVVRNYSWMTERMNVMHEMSRHIRTH